MLIYIIASIEHEISFSERERDRERLRERIRETEWSVGFIFCTGYQINFVKNIAIGTSHYSFPTTYEDVWIDVCFGKFVCIIIK